MNIRISDLSQFNKIIKTRFPAGGLIGVEIGSLNGHSAEAFVLSGNFKVLHCIDPWKKYDLTGQNSNNLYDAEIYEKDFDEMMSKYSQLVKIKKTSADALAEFKDATLDFIYIDALHTYNGVKFDILNWAKKLKLGGILSGHDYNNTWPGVVQAVDELVDINYKDNNGNWANFNFLKLKV